MPPHDHPPDTRTLAEQALAWGASLAGVASVADLRRAPSFVLAEQGVAVPGGRGGRPGDTPTAGEPVLLPQVVWPPSALSVLVIALSHPEEEPQLDWWRGRSDPPGNRALRDIADRLCRWLADDWGVACTHLPYHVESGGIYLKDAAVLAGLGVIGRNNLLVTPEYGPRVRLRALATSADLPSAGPPQFDPCRDCPAPCQSECPREAFAAPAAKTTRLGATAGFSRPACYLQMDADVEAAAPAMDAPAPGESEGSPSKIIKYCRACELGCVARSEDRSRDASHVSGTETGRPWR